MTDIVSLSTLSHAASQSQIQLDHTRASSETNLTSRPGSAGAGDPSSDSISLSNASILVQNASSAGADARAARVQQLKQQIATGQYQIDIAALSKSVVAGAIAGE